MAHYYLGRVNLAVGRYEEGIAKSLKAKSLAVAALQLAYAHAVSGNPAEAHLLLAEAARRSLVCDETIRACSLPDDILQSETTYLSPVGIATVHIGLGEIDLAFEWLRRGYEELDPMLAYLKVDPVFAPLRGDPRGRLESAAAPE